MATAWIRVGDVDGLPGVCIKSGEPTDVRLPMTAEYVPAAFQWLQLFAVWSFLFARSAGRRRRQVRLPVSRRAFRRHRAWEVTCASLFVAGLVAGFVGSLTAHPVAEFAGYGAVVVGLVAGVRSRQRSWVGITVDRRGREITVSRCHPAFAQAAGRLAASRR